MDIQPTTLVFDTRGELDAFMKGYSVGVNEDCEGSDCASYELNGKWCAELLKVCDKDYQVGGRYYIEGEAEQAAC